MTEKCELQAMFRFTWPGRNEAFICMGHVQKLENVAITIGLPLQIIPLRPDELEGKTCQQIK
jgi:hypothetical protein